MIEGLRFAHAGDLDVSGDRGKHRGRQGEVEEPVSLLFALFKLRDGSVEVLKRSLLSVGAFAVGIDGPELLQLGFFAILELLIE